MIRESVKRNNGMHIWGITEHSNNDSDDSHWLYTVARKNRFAKVLHFFELAAKVSKGLKKRGDKFKNSPSTASALGKGEKNSAVFAT